MQIHELKPDHKSKDRKIVGRGGKKGSYSGKGIKGQSSRAGRKMVPIIRELIKRYPKLKGYRAFVLQDNSVTVDLSVLEKKTKDGDVINPQNLILKKIIHLAKGKVPTVKILGNGKLTKKLIIENCKVSKGAKEIIEKAGGTVRI